MTRSFKSELVSLKRLQELNPVFRTALFLWIILFCLPGNLTAQDTILTIKMAKTPEKGQQTFSVSIFELGRRCIVTNDSLKILKATSRGPFKIEYAIKLSDQESWNFYSLLIDQQLDTLQDRYSFPTPGCDDCSSITILKISGDQLPDKTIMVFNASVSQVYLVIQAADDLIRKKKYKIYK